MEKNCQMIKSSQVSCKINPNTQYMYLLPPHPYPIFLPHFIIVIFNHNLLAINLWPPVDPTPTQPQKSFSSDVKVITESQTRDPWTGSLSQTILYSLYILHSLCIEYSLSRFFLFIVSHFLDHLMLPQCVWTPPTHLSPPTRILFDPPFYFQLAHMIFYLDTAALIACLFST